MEDEHHITELLVVGEPTTVIKRCRCSIENVKQGITYSAETAGTRVLHVGCGGIISPRKVRHLEEVQKGK